MQMLKVIDEEKLQENCEKVGTYFINELAKLKDEFDIIGDVRGKGLMIGVELVEDRV
jgi:alanine-glyoxylate transaminase/(R)-3-amino-2-methylpropionate-pyruvate transaminase